MVKKIATHNKMFHADEITAIALLKVFTSDTIEIHRIDHNSSDFSQYDMVIDIGRKFDGKKHFDHHQYKGGKSSAGLIWDYLGLSKEHPKISKFIDAIDKHDTGIQKAKEFEFSSLIKCYNSRGLDDDKQMIQFNKAVEFTMTILNSMKQMKEELMEAETIVKNSFYFDGNTKIIELEKFTPHWGSYINGLTTPNIKAVVWEDSKESLWKVKIPSKVAGSYELNSKGFSQDSSMEFVHSSGHFAIAKDEMTMKSFLQKMIK